MSKKKQIDKMFPLLQGRRVKIYRGPVVMYTGEAAEWSGMYLTLKNVVAPNGDTKNELTLHAQQIDKIEFSE